jgi:hypothetical protein
MSGVHQKQLDTLAFYSFYYYYKHGANNRSTYWSFIKLQLANFINPLHIKKIFFYEQDMNCVRQKNECIIIEYLISSKYKHKILMNKRKGRRVGISPPFY